MRVSWGHRLLISCDDDDGDHSLVADAVETRPMVPASSNVVVVVVVVSWWRRTPPLRPNH